jgi:uncharacterized protein YqeY
VGLRTQLEQDLRDAMRAGDALRVSTIRLALASLKNTEIEKRRDLSEEEVQEVLQREVKRRREAIEAFRGGGRDELAEKESLEMAILLGYLPQPLTEEELRRMVDEAIGQARASSPRDMGRVMSAVMPRVKGRADGNTVSRIVRERLERAGPA